MQPNDGMILVKNPRGRVIGFERPSFLPAKQGKQAVSIPTEVQPV